MGRVAGSASPASRLPQVMGAAQARDGAGCRIIIAGKPAPTGNGCSAGQGWGGLQSQHRRQPAPTGNGCSAGLVGAGLPGMGRVAESASPASRLPQIVGAVQALWELACQGWGGLQGQHRRQAGSHRYWVQCRPCGSWLASDGAGCRVSIAGSRLPQVMGAVQALWELACQGWGGLQGQHRRPGQVAGSASPASRLP